MMGVACGRCGRRAHCMSVSGPAQQRHKGAAKEVGSFSYAGSLCVSAVFFVMPPCSVTGGACAGNGGAPASGGVDVSGGARFSAAPGDTAGSVSEVAGAEGVVAVLGTGEDAGAGEVVD